MTRWWSLARGEWILLAIVAGGGVGVAVASILGITGVGAWVACIGLALFFGGLAQVATRGHGDADLPTVGLGPTLLVGVPLLAAWWIIAALAGIPTSGFSPAYLTWFVGGLLVARVLARVLSTFAARNKSAEGHPAGTPRTPS